MLKGLEASRRPRERAFAHRPATIALDVANTKRLFASYSLRLSDAFASERLAGTAYIFALPPRSTRSVDYKAVFPRRGYTELEGIEVATRYPFGFFERKLSLRIRERLLVYPEILPFASSPRAALKRPGQTESPERGEGASLRALRDYNEFDSAKRIVWKISARVNRLIVAETERETEARHQIALNNIVPAGGKTPEAAERFERAVSFVASLGTWLRKQGETAIVHLPAGSVTARNEVDMERLLRALALIELMDEGEAANAPPEARPRVRWATPSAVQLLYANEARVCSSTLEFREWSERMGEGAAESDADGQAARERFAA